MATNPRVRKVDDEAVQSPEELDALIGRGVSPEHRAILLAALTQTSSRAFNELLASMPNVGEDSDFAPNRG